MTSRQPYLCTKQWIGGHVCVQKISVGIELFSHVKTFFYSKQFVKLKTTWLKTDYILCFIIPLKQKIITLNKLNMGFLIVPNLVPWLISDVNILDVRVWMINDQFCCISLHFSSVCYPSCQFLTWQQRGAGWRLFEEGDYFKYFGQRGSIILGRRLIEGRLLLEEIRYFILFQACERAEFSKSCNLIGCESGRYFMILPANPGRIVGSFIHKFVCCLWVSKNRDF